MADSEYTLQDMLQTVHDGSPTKFADYFSGVMVDKVNDKVDTIRQAVAAKLGGEDPSSYSAMELGPEEVDDADDASITVTASADEEETELDDEEQVDGEETEGTDRED